MLTDISKTHHGIPTINLECRRIAKKFQRCVLKSAVHSRCVQLPTRKHAEKPDFVEGKAADDRNRTQGFQIYCQSDFPSSILHLTSSIQS